MSTITVYRGWLEPGRYVWSPFVTKVEARLRFSNIPYKTAAGNPKTAPKGKIPYIEITEGNEANPRTNIGDSTLIIKHLVESNTLPDLNGELAPELKANDLAIRALLEDKAYFYNTRERWTENYYTMRDHVLGAVPYPIRVILGMFIHRTMVQTLHGQGTGRYSADEIQEFRVEAWNAVNDLLVASKAKQTQHQGQEGDAGRPFWVLGGEEPTEADMTVFGFVISALICTAGSKARELVMGFPVMREYARRIHDEYFPDYELWDE